MMSHANQLTLQGVESELGHMGDQLAALLPPDVSQDRFRQVVLAAFRLKPELLNLNQQSLFNACLSAAQDGLMPDGREGAIVPRKGVAVWQPMIAGIIKRVKSTGSVVNLVANVVYEGETFDVLLGDEDRIVHRRDMAAVHKGREIAVYAIATLKDGTKEREIMSWDQVQDVRKASAMPNSGPWIEWPDEMARKTVIRRLAKRLPVLEPADEMLQRTIARVDSLYDFGKPAAAIEAKVRPPTLEHQAPPAAAASVQRARRIVAPPSPSPNVSPESDADKWLKGVQLRLATVQTVDELAKVQAIPSVASAREHASTEIKEQLADWFTDAYARVRGKASPDDATDDMESAAEPPAPPSRTKTVPAGVGTDMNDAIPF